MSDLPYGLPPGFVPLGPAAPPASPPPTGLPPGFAAVDPNNQPPPGVIIHDANRSYVTGPGGQSVDTTGMDQADRQAAAAALRLRQTGEVPSLGPRALQPGVQGATFSWGDELTSIGAAAREWLKGRSFSDAYRVAQEAQRQDLAQEREEHPYRSAGTQLVGSLVTGLPLAGATPGLTATTLAGRIGQGAVTGGGLGLVEGAGSGSGWQGRGESAVTGAGLGAAAGAVAPVAGELGGNFYRWLRDQSLINRNLGQIGLGRRAADNLLLTGEADDAFTGLGRANIQAAGPDAMLADAGPGYRGLLDMVTRRTPQATNAAGQAIGDRMGQANQNFRGALDNALGPPHPLDSTTRQIREASEAARDQAYQAFHNAPVNWAHPRAGEIDAALAHVPNRDSIARSANELLTLWEGGGAPRIGLDAGGRFAGSGGIDRFGREVFDQRLNSQQLDYLTRALRQQQSETLGPLGGQTDVSAGYARAAGRIRGIMRDIIPESGTAWDTAADPISRIAATKAGAAALSKETTRDEVRETLRNMQPGERQAYLSAARGDIDETMAKVQYASAKPDYDAKQLTETLHKLNSQQAREKLIDMVGDPVAVDRLMTEIGHSTRATELAASQAANSATFGRGAIAARDAMVGAPGTAGNFRAGRPMDLVRGGWQRLWGGTPADELRGRDLSDLQIARTLTGPRGQDALDTLQRLTGAYQTGQANQAAAQRVGQQFGAGTGLTSYYMLPGLLQALGLPSPR